MNNASPIKEGKGGADTVKKKARTKREVRRGLRTKSPRRATIWRVPEEA